MARLTETIYERLGIPDPAASTPVASTPVAEPVADTRTADITQAYQDILGRAPDPEGLNYWTSSGQDINTIRSNIQLNENQQIEQLYKDILGRAADTEGLNYWAQSGQNLDTIRNNILASQEAQQKSAPTTQTPYGNYSVEEIVTGSGGDAGFNTEYALRDPLGNIISSNIEAVRDDYGDITGYRAPGSREYGENAMLDLNALSQQYGSSLVKPFGTGFGQALGFEYGLRNSEGDLFQKYDAQGNLTEYLDRDGIWQKASDVKPVGTQINTDTGQLETVYSYDSARYGSNPNIVGQYVPGMSKYHEDQGGFLGEGGWGNIAGLVAVALTANPALFGAIGVPVTAGRAIVQGAAALARGMNNGQNFGEALTGALKTGLISAATAGALEKLAELGTFDATKFGDYEFSDVAGRFSDIVGTDSDALYNALKDVFEQQETISALPGSESASAITSDAGAVGLPDGMSVDISGSPYSTINPEGAPELPSGWALGTPDNVGSVYIPEINSWVQPASSAFTTALPQEAYANAIDALTEAGFGTTYKTIDALSQVPDVVVSAAFNAFFGRDPSAQELGYFLKRAEGNQWVAPQDLLKDVYDAAQKTKVDDNVIWMDQDKSLEEILQQDTTDKTKTEVTQKDQVKEEIEKTEEEKKKEAGGGGGGGDAGGGGASREEGIAKLYEDILGRAPDAEGLKYWSESGQSLESIARDMQLNENAQIAQLYIDILGRAPDADGLKYWAESGDTLEEIASNMRIIKDILDASGGGAGDISIEDIIGDGGGTGGSGTGAGTGDGSGEGAGSGTGTGTGTGSGEGAGDGSGSGSGGFGGGLGTGVGTGSGTGTGSGESSGEGSGEGSGSGDGEGDGEGKDDLELRLRRLRDLERMLAAPSRAARVMTPEPAKIEYVYDIGGESVFATPKQESLMLSPFEDIPEAVEGVRPYYQYFIPGYGYTYADGGMVAFEDGGLAALNKPEKKGALARMIEPDTKVFEALAAYGSDPQKYEEIYSFYTNPDRPLADESGKELPSGLAEMSKDYSGLDMAVLGLIHSAKQSGDPERFLESLAPYYNKKVKFDFTDRLGPTNYVMPIVAPNTANIGSKGRRGEHDIRSNPTSNIFFHEMEHTLQNEARGYPSSVLNALTNDAFLSDMDKDALKRATEYRFTNPTTEKTMMFPAENAFDNPSEVLANIAAVAQGMAVQGKDFLQTPEGQALFPTDADKNYFYNAVLPGVTSIRPYMGFFQPEDRTSRKDESLARKAVRKLGFENGGLIEDEYTIDDLYRMLGSK